MNRGKTSAVAPDQDQLRAWIGRTEAAADWLEPERCRALQATLDSNGPQLQEGDPLPALWHWLYFRTLAPRSTLGRDGHPALGGFLPPVGEARRMWAGSRVRFLAPLRIGDEVRRISTVSDVFIKHGQSGRLVFVTVQHEISNADGTALVDQQDIVYRQPDLRPAPTDGGRKAPGTALCTKSFETDSTLLFRYSALTFNGHRIHYDREYATRVEGYPGLVVHGPLLATLMVELAGRAWPDRRIMEFRFRGQRPIFDARPFTVCADPQDANTLSLWVADANGLLSMRGSAGFALPG